MDEIKQTPFSAIYDVFLTRVTDEMFIEFTELDTLGMLQDLLVSAIARFEFPKFDIWNHDLGSIDDYGTYSGVESDYSEVPAIAWIGGTFYSELTEEEKHILALSMVVEWLGQQLATSENTKLKYTGSDFKMSSQANHMAKLKVLKEEAEKECLHYQRLYSRRKFVDGKVRSTFGSLMEEPSYGYQG